MLQLHHVTIKTHILLPVCTGFLSYRVVPGSLHAQQDMIEDDMCCSSSLKAKDKTIVQL